MQIIKPQYYDDFHCIADKCPKTCCSGWQIMIDEKSLKKYGKLSGRMPSKKSEVKSFNQHFHNEDNTLGNRILECVDWEDQCFKQKNDGRCVFLNEENLCDLYLEARNDDIFCDTCRLYPRHIEEFENVRENSLGLSCPQACHIILNDKRKFSLISEEDEDEEEYEDFDYLLYSKLIYARELILDILSTEDISLDLKKSFILDFGDALQEKSDLYEIFLMDEVTDSYRSRWEQICSGDFIYDKGYSEKLLRRQVFYRAFNEMEPLDVNAKSHMLEILVGGNDTFYSENADINNAFNRILIYFVYVYFCGACYDDLISSKLYMAVMAQEIIEDICRFSNEKSDMALVEKVTVDFCRELEHSDENIELVQDIAATAQELNATTDLFGNNVVQLEESGQSVHSSADDLGDIIRKFRV